MKTFVFLLYLLFINSTGSLYYWFDIVTLFYQLKSAEFALFILINNINFCILL